MLDWKIKDNSTAYILQGNNLYFTDKVAFDENDEPYCYLVTDDLADFDIDSVTLESDKITVHNWGELCQFNCCGLLLEETLFLSKIHEELYGLKNTLDITTALAQTPCFALTEVVSHPNKTFDLITKITIFPNYSFELKQQFSKYVFIDGSILEYSDWTIPKLYNFAVHLQKQLTQYEQKFTAKDQTPMFLQTDNEILSAMGLDRFKFQG